MVQTLHYEEGEWDGYQGSWWVWVRDGWTTGEGQSVHEGTLEGVLVVLAACHRVAP
jgi:hypothetical protein